MTNRYRRTEMTTHHLVPKSKKGTNDEDNLLRMSKTQHQALHTLFDNDTPMEQIYRLLEINESVFQGDFLHDIMEVLDLYGEDIYHSSVRQLRNKVKKALGNTF